MNFILKTVGLDWDLCDLQKSLLTTDISGLYLKIDSQERGQREWGPDSNPGQLR